MIRVTCLASGSSGNSLLIQHDERALLIDAGMTAKALTTCLTERGVGLGSLDGVLITHEHGDHIRGADVLARRFGAPLIANRATLAALGRPGRGYEQLELAAGSGLDIGPFEACSFPVSHDAVDPVGYVVRVGGASIASMTDLGDLTPDLFEAAAGSDLVVVEANHDTQLLLDGPYPAYLKRRIMSHRGHLSNRQTAELIGSSMSDLPQTYWLAHLSETNNTKEHARAGVAGFLAQYGLEPVVFVTGRDMPSLVWEPSMNKNQLPLFGAEAS